MISELRAEIWGWGSKKFARGRAFVPTRGFRLDAWRQFWAQRKLTKSTMLPDGSGAILWLSMSQVRKRGRMRCSWDVSKQETLSDRSAMAGRRENERWQREVTNFLEDDGAAPDRAMEPRKQGFHL